MDIREQLRQSDFFSSLSPKNLRMLADICLPKRAARRETLFLEGQQGGLFFHLINGRIQLYRLNAEGREIAIKVVGPGEIFAEVILFEADRYPVCAATLTDCELLAIPTFQFGCLLESPEFRNDFIVMLMKASRIRNSSYLIASAPFFVFKSVAVSIYP